MPAEFAVNFNLAIHQGNISICSAAALAGEYLVQQLAQGYTTCADQTCHTASQTAEAGADPDSECLARR